MGPSRRMFTGYKSYNANIFGSFNGLLLNMNHKTEENEDKVVVISGRITTPGRLFPGCESVLHILHKHKHQRNKEQRTGIFLEDFATKCYLSRAYYQHITSWDRQVSFFSCHHNITIYFLLDN